MDSDCQCQRAISKNFYALNTPLKSGICSKIDLKYLNEYLNFKSTSVANNGEGNLTISGDLTIKGVTKAVILEGELSEVAVDPYGQTKVGLSVSGKIKRSEFGLSWGAVTEAGHVVLGDDIKINSELHSPVISLVAHHLFLLLILV